MYFVIAVLYPTLTVLQQTNVEVQWNWSEKLIVSGDRILILTQITSFPSGMFTKNLQEICVSKTYCDIYIYKKLYVRHATGLHS